MELLCYDFVPRKFALNNLMQPAGHFVTDMLLNLIWKLSDDPLAEHVGHSQCLEWICHRRKWMRMVAMQVGYSFLESEIQMFPHHGFHLIERPILGVGTVEKSAMSSALAYQRAIASFCAAVSPFFAAWMISAAIRIWSLSKSDSCSPAASP